MRDSEYVYIVEDHATRPVFHRRGEDGEEGGFWRVWSVCGQEIIRDGERYMWSATHVALRHARAFGRPCRHCWREDPPYLLFPSIAHTSWRSVGATG